VLVEDGRARLEMATDDRDEPWVDFDAAARTLVIWGRRPDQRGRFRCHIPAPMLARLQALLAGY
jgi:hypothetical protein